MFAQLGREPQEIKQVSIKEEAVLTGSLEQLRADTRRQLFELTRLVIDLRATLGATISLVETVEFNTGGIRTQLKDLAVLLKLSSRAQITNLDLKLSLLTESIELGDARLLDQLVIKLGFLEKALIDISALFANEITTEVTSLATLIEGGFSNQEQLSNVEFRVLETKLSAVESAVEGLRTEILSQDTALQNIMENQLQMERVLSRMEELLKRLPSSKDSYPKFSLFR